MTSQNKSILSLQKYLTDTINGKTPHSDYAKFADISEMFLQTLIVSEKFILDMDTCEMLRQVGEEYVNKSDDTDFFKLPYEYMTLHIGGAATDEIPYGISAIVSFMDTEYADDDYKQDILFKQHNYDVLGMISFFNPKKNNSIWNVLPAVCGIQYTGRSQFRVNLHYGDNFLQNEWEDDEKEYFHNVALLCAGVLAQLLAFLSCGNASTELVKQPEKLNKKRVKKGNLPYYDYHVLTLTDRKKTRPAAAQGGTHASPRFHMRRGHIRQYKSGKRVWIHDTTVGDPRNGYIEKDYKVKSIGS